MSRIDQHGAVLSLCPNASIGADTIDELDDALRQNQGIGIPQLVIDLSETPLVDSAGLEWILSLDEAYGKRGGCVRLCGATELCRDILRITDVGSRIQHFGNLAEALGSFA
jgi:anti-anti-sigma factor